MSLTRVTQVVMSSNAISTEKIAALTFNTNFKVPYTSILNLLKSATFAVNLNKLYIYYFYIKDN